MTQERSWQSRLAKLARYGDQLPEPLCACFHARPPVRQVFPKGLPSSPTLVEFYSLCDGGQFKDYEFLPLTELRAGKEAVTGWPGDIDWDAEKGLTPGRWLVLGCVDSGPPFLWDEGKDDIALTDFDAPYDEVQFLGRSLAGFLEKLFDPSSAAEDTQPLESRLWLEALWELDKFD